MTAPIEIDGKQLVNTLFDEAKKKGFLTYSRILEVLPDSDANLPLIENIVEMMSEANMPIHDNEKGLVKAKPSLVEAVEEPTPEELLAEVAVVEEVEKDLHAAPLFDLTSVPIDDSVGLYFREMGQQSLLTAEQEVTLAMEIEAGRDAGIELEEQKDMLNYRQQDDLSQVFYVGEAARAHLIRANTRLVVSIAKKYRGRGLNFLDLIQEGNVGLMKAVEKYDYRRGNRFSTYATWWIRQAVTRALANHGRTIRIPAHLGGRISKLYQVAQELEQELGRQPNAEEIAKQMELPAERVRWMLRTSRQPVHLERPVGDESDAELGDFIEDVEAPPPAESVASNMLSEEIGEILDQLTPREARILRLRYGLQDGESRTLKEVGEMFGLSRERIRQLEKEALRKLRHPNFGGHLSQYLN